MELAAGTQIGPYEIADLLGAGGMGEVYRAVDTRLGRQVAIKLLVSTGADSDRLRRFEVEKRTVGSLQHANILALYDVGKYEGRPFLVSELLQGETLRDQLSRSAVDSARAVDLAVQLCHGLTAAHDKGIVHRDIKPENLFITKEGVLKILDFGIAKRADRAMSAEAEQPMATVTLETEVGTILGTAGYMSPEQVRGQPADSRSDLFAAGVVLYEMLAGHRAFQRETALESAYAVLKDEPADLPATVAPALVEIVRRCLEKQPDDRFQSARDLAGALDASRAPTQRPAVVRTETSQRAPAKGAPSNARVDALPPRESGWAEKGTAPGQVLSPVLATDASRRNSALRAARGLTIAVVLLIAGSGSWLGWRHLQGILPPDRIMMAVLPFEDFSGDAQKEYFAEGLTEGMISQLGRLQPDRLAVIARTSVNQYRGTKKSVKEIGHELGVKYVLECSMVRVESRVSVDARLIQTTDQTQIWAESYEREIKDMLALQSDVARAIAAQVRVKLNSEQQAGLSKTRSLDPAAYDAYLRGEYFRAKMTEEGLTQAIKYFQQATELDSNYAAAFAALASALAGQPMFDLAPEADAGPPAKVAALRSLALDDGLAEAHAAFAAILLTYEHDWPGAERQYRRAIELDPNSASIHRSYAVPYLESLGRRDEVLAELKRAVELSPLSLMNNCLLGNAYAGLKEYDRAIAQLRRAIELDPSNPMTHGYIASIYEDRGMYEEALVELEKFGVTADSSQPDVLARLARCHARAGHQAEAERIVERAETLARTEEAEPYAFVALYAAVGRRDEAFSWLEKGYERRAWWLITLRTNPRFDLLRDDPRFIDMMRRVGIPEPSRATP